MNIFVKHLFTFNKRAIPILQIFYTVIILGFICNASAFSADNESALLDALKSDGHFALLRHALAPGTGDPPEFQLGQCTTQRNLSDEGRDQARTIGGLFRENEIHKVRVFSSQWCRCMETAKLLALGPVAELPVLNSFFQHYERRESQTRMLLEWLGKQNLDRPTVLVTHQVNITALTGIYPDSGELVIVHRSPSGNIKVIGTIETR
jgi:broad specificity phosphatase PhoE